MYFTYICKKIIVFICLPLSSPSNKNPKIHLRHCPSSIHTACGMDVVHWATWEPNQWQWQYFISLSNEISS